MPIDPYFLSRFPLVQGISSFAKADEDPSILRRIIEFGDSNAPWQQPDSIESFDTSAPGPNGGIPMRLYRPRDASRRRRSLLWMHGGAWVGGTLDWAEAHAVSAELAARANCVVASVDYRLVGGDVRYPAPYDDVHAAWLWFVGQQESWRIPGLPAIGGASAGANLAAGVAMRLSDEGLPGPTMLVLAYPLVHFPIPPIPPALHDEMRGVPELLRFHAPEVFEMHRNLIGRLHDIPRYVAPANHDLTLSPPVAVVISEYDDLRTGAELYVDQLTEAGVPVEVHLARGMLHGHLNRFPNSELPEVERSLDFLAASLRASERQSQDTHAAQRTSPGEEI